MSDFHVAIVGGGPAGAWTAFQLARAGARVAIVDGSHPREKPCGGGLSARALQLLRPLPDAVRASGNDDRHQHAFRMASIGPTCRSNVRARRRPRWS